jgi:hypothetical protein
MPIPTYSIPRTRAPVIAQPVPIAISAQDAAPSFREKTCRTIASPRRQLKRAPKMSAATSKPCKRGVIGMSKTTCAMIAGIRDRVQANTTPNPTAYMKSPAIMPALYALGIWYWVCSKVKRQAVPRIAGPSPQSSANRR